MYIVLSIFFSAKQTILKTVNNNNNNNNNFKSVAGHYHIFVGDLSPDVETHQLREAFAPFGQTT